MANFRMVPLEVEGGNYKTEWPLSELEYNQLVDLAEKEYGQKPSKISFLIRFPQPPTSQQVEIIKALTQSITDEW